MNIEKLFPDVKKTLLINVVTRGFNKGFSVTTQMMNHVTVCII